MELKLQRSPQDIRTLFPRLSTPKEIADLLEIDYKSLIYHLYRLPEISRYMVFEVPKRSGGTRTIRAPISKIKILQRKLSFILQLVYKPKASVHGFVRDKSVVTNANRHCRKLFVLNVDLENFFPSINFGRVRGMFMAKPYSFPDKVATVLAQLCCIDNQLPQGAPTSPVVSNMVCSRLDTHLRLLASRFRCTYTRYADDITISTTVSKFPEGLAILDTSTLPVSAKAGDELTKVITDNGFQINAAKTRLQNSHSRQEVTGLTTNEFPNVQRRYTNQLRSMLHAWEKYGLVNAEKEYQTKYNKKHRGPFKPPPSFKLVVHGKLNFLAMVRGQQDSIFLKLSSKLATLDPDYAIVYAEKLFAQGDRNNPANALWVLEGSEFQGTGFFLEGVGLVTCHHVIFHDKNDFTKAFRPQNPTKKYDIKVIKFDEDFDLAILEIDYPAPITLRRGNSDLVNQGDEIRVLGFPNYSPGQMNQLYTGHVAGFKMLFGARRIMIDAPIIQGNSGGPVLNDKNEVIGIAYRGVDTVDKKLGEEQGATAVKVIDDLQKKPV